ncbi:hypothetical protein [Luteolibacter luteus]|uniref:Uncharacterized protein n=1 Tax=Luteolibacter luteus TaxID=2728835 RepID=A0A858RMM7_9BACT|nr:hypothetical protein [Luteolibacter luteus]QJE98092.1 hypothetical protein HHL09_20655 [Luteolibacter luteus]
MRVVPRTIAIFLSGCGVTCLSWALLRSEIGSRARTEPREPVVERLQEASWPEERIVASIKAANDAQDDDAKLRSALELGKIPIKDIPAALQSLLGHQRTASLPACRTLLVRWASHDGEAAINWAWKHLKEKGDWHEAYREIVAAWSWQDPESFHRWCLASPNVSYDERHKAAERGKTSEVPVVDMFFAMQAIMALSKSDVHLAYDLVAKRGGGFFGMYPQLAAELETANEIQDALAALPEPGDLKVQALNDSDKAAKALLERWREIDPDDFASSRYSDRLMPDAEKILGTWNETSPGQRATLAAALLSNLEGEPRAKQIEEITRCWAAGSVQETAQWLGSLTDAESAYPVLAGLRAPQDLEGTLDWAESLSPADEAASIAQAHEAWTAAHPGQAPDTSGWSAARLQAWQDMDALGGGSP